MLKLGATNINKLLEFPFIENTGTVGQVKIYHKEAKQTNPQYKIF